MQKKTQRPVNTTNKDNIGRSHLASHSHDGLIEKRIGSRECIVLEGMSTSIKTYNFIKFRLLKDCVVTFYGLSVYINQILLCWSLNTIGIVVQDGTAGNMLEVFCQFDIN